MNSTLSALTQELDLLEAAGDNRVDARGMRVGFHNRYRDDVRLDGHMRRLVSLVGVEASAGPDGQVEKLHELDNVNNLLAASRLADVRACAPVGFKRARNGSKERRNKRLELLLIEAIVLILQIHVSRSGSHIPKIRDPETWVKTWIHDAG